MKDKYYTPEIEEFHIGFEYEVDWGPFKWKKAIYQDYMTADSMCDDVRVKYLDKEDIESLGFIEDPDFTYLHTFKRVRNNISIYTRNWGVFSIVNEDRMKNNIVFTGTIKNKSELKKLMKQLGI
jgi:hypothetical protein